MGSKKPEGAVMAPSITPVPAWYFYDNGLHIYVNGEIVAIIPTNAYKNLAQELIEELAK